MMGKHLVIMRYLNSTICIVLLLWGCDRTFDATEQPKVVRKKVVTQKEQIAKVRTNETIRTEKTANAAPKSKVVRKKVVARNEQTAKTHTNQTIRDAKTNQSVGRSEKKTAAAKDRKISDQSQEPGSPRYRIKQADTGRKKNRSHTNGRYSDETASA